MDKRYMEEKEEEGREGGKERRRRWRSDLVSDGLRVELEDDREACLGRSRGRLLRPKEIEMRDQKEIQTTKREEEKRMAEKEGTRWRWLW